MLAVRTAIIEDWPAILAMVKAYAERAASLPGLVFDLEATREIVARHVAAGTAIVATVDKEPAGALLLDIVPSAFGKNLFASEALWWVNPEHRRTGVGVALIEFGEEVARQRGAMGMIVHTFSLGTQSAADAALASHGYARVNTGWHKEV